VFTSHRERLPTGRDHPHTRRPPEDVADQLSRRFEQVLAVVEDKQRLLVLEVGMQQASSTDDDDESRGHL
jgi:hypothetical protein